MTRASPLPRTVVLVGNPHSGHVTQGLDTARQALAREGLQVLQFIRMRELDSLREWIARPAAERPLIVAAGGDGTVGAVTNYVAHTEAILGILPLGTSNDVARSLGIPMGITDAVHLLATGKVATVDLGQFFAVGEPPRYFVHAAAMGIDVHFAKLATQVSLRKRLGRFTYVVAALVALREMQPFTCELHIDGRTMPLCLLHLSVVNAPIFGGRFGFHMVGSSIDDRRLDVLAIEDAPLHRLILAAVPLLIRKRAHTGSMRLYHVPRLHVHIENALDVSLDGEVAARIPGDFVLAPEALRVVAPLSFEDVDD